MNLPSQATNGIPDEIKGWNWGAFFLNWIWGLFNGTFIALLALVPCLNLIMPFILGFKGNEWAWQNKKWESVEAFKATQRKWSIAGFILFLAMIVAGALMFTGIFALMKQSDVYQESLSRAQNHPALISALGTPIEAGFFVTGNINVSTDTGKANISYSVCGPQGKAKIYVQAHKKFDAWVYEDMSAELENGRIIPLLE